MESFNRKNPMKQVVIENPIINSPFDESKRHFRFSDEGITNEIVEGRRTSSYFIPIARPKKKGSRQLHFDIIRPVYAIVWINAMVADTDS